MNTKPGLDGIKASREESLKNPPPTVKRISTTEIYLLDPATEKRKKRICGKQKKDMPEGYVCLNEAGKNTNHPGYGFCSIHERHLPQHVKVSMWKRINQENPNMLPKLGVALDICDRIQDEDLRNVDEDIKMLYALLQVHLDCKPEDWKKDAADHALNLVKEIIKAKEAKTRIEKTILLDPKSIAGFLKQIFSIIKKTLTEQDAKIILQTIYNDVVIPMNKRGTTGRDAAEYYGSKYGTKIEDAEHEDVTDEQET